MKKGSRPKITAIVSTYNSSRFIRGCLENLLSQTAVEDMEIIVVDSASEEDEGAIVAEYASSFPDIRYMRTAERESLYKSWNRGIRLARGRYVTMANTDDRSRHDAYEIMSRELDQNPRIALVYTDFYRTPEMNADFDGGLGNSRLKCVKPFSKRHVLEGCCLGPRPMYRKAIHARIGYFNENYISAGDYEFWLRIAEHYRMKHIPQPLTVAYDNWSGISFSSDASQRETEKAYLDFLRGAFGTKTRSRTVKVL